VCGAAAAAILAADHRATEEPMARQGHRIAVTLQSSAGTGHVYMTNKSRRNTPDRLEIKKYDPVARQHVVYKEKR
jgi:large subunit ribosomal protein L33